MGRQAKSMRNWDGSITSRPAARVSPANVSELIAVITNTKKYPSPVRAVGAFSSSTRCAAADGGTVVDMGKMNRILEYGEGYIRVQAGARLYEVARELQKRGLEFAASPGPSVMSMGSAACGATLAPAMPGQSGQLSS
ncbi:MAG: FAD-dependent oxidoreductase [Chromatiales bacterium]